MQERFIGRIDEKLCSLARRLEKARKPLDRGPVERQIGRLLARNSRAAGRYQVKVVVDSTRASGLRLEWFGRPEWEDWARHSEGCYVLRTNVRDFSPEELWKIYVQLTEAESAFRVHKSDLGLRPIWHHKEGRVQAHIFVCFLAYAMWKVVRPDKSQAYLLDRLGLRLPERLRIPTAIKNVVPTYEANCAKMPDQTP